MQVGVVQFVKGRSDTGEEAFFRRQPEVEWHVMGDGFTWDTQDRSADIASARAGWSKSALPGRPGDRPGGARRLNIVLKYGYLEVAEVIADLQARPALQHVIVTGRGAPEALHRGGRHRHRHGRRQARLQGRHRRPGGAWSSKPADAVSLALLPRPPCTASSQPRPRRPRPFRRPAFAHEWVDFEATAQDEVATRLAGATIAVVNKRRLTADLIAALPALQMVAVAATGYNNIDPTPAGRAASWSPTRGYARETVPEHVFALLLALIRQIGPYHRSVAAGRWQQSEQFCYFDYPIRDLAGRKLGILGSGTSARASRASPRLGMTVLRGEHKGAPAVREGYVPSSG